MSSTIKAMMKNIMVLTTFVILVSLPLGCSRKQSKASASAPEVLVAVVAPQDVPIIRESVSTLNGLVNADINARVSGYIVSQDYKEGSFVKKGDLLFQIDPRPFEEALAQAKGNLDKAKATHARAEQDEKRALELFSKQVTSAQERDLALQAAGAAKGDTEAEEAAVKAAELNLEYTKITAPIDGVTGFATKQVGDLVGTTTGPLTSISQVDPIKAVASVGERALSEFVTRYPDADKRDEHLRSLEFELLLTDETVYAHKGKFYAIDRNVDVKTGSIRFEVTFPNPGNVLRAGQFGRVRVVTDIKNGALVIPQQAVSELQGNYQVMVVGNDNKASIRPVKMGERFGALWEVVDGLKAGERIIVQGSQKVREGRPVTTREYAPSAEMIASATSAKAKER